MLVKPNTLTFTFVLFCFVSIFLFPFKKLPLFRNTIVFLAPPLVAQACQFTFFPFTLGLCLEQASLDFLPASEQYIVVLAARW